MTRRESFIAERQDRWDALEQLLTVRLDRAQRVAELSRLYRAVSADLALASSQELPEDILQYLDTLAARAHNRLYGNRQLRGFAPVRFLVADFPRELRSRPWMFLLANVLLYGPMVLTMVACLVDPELASRVIPAEQLHQMSEMYSTPTGRGGGDADAQMAGFYIYNNVGIAFRCFSTGIFGGLGSLFFLVYNGAMMGTTFGYLIAMGRGTNLLTFVSGHSSWELMGIAVSGCAGLRMGWALLVTEGRTRTGSLREAGPGLFRLVGGFTAMIVVAAAIEGFWSASPVPMGVKAVFGVLQWGIVAAWLGLGGRR